MAHIVCEPCVDCKSTDCVEVCPVECFYEADNCLYINPEECIDCGACIPECPPQAIFTQDDVPEKWLSYIDKNRLECDAGAKNITKKAKPLKENCPDLRDTL